MSKASLNAVAAGETERDFGLQEKSVLWESTETSLDYSF
jgi:hypothetical protein